MKKVLLCIVTDNINPKKIKQETEKYTEEALENEFEIPKTCVFRIYKDRLRKIKRTLKTIPKIKYIALTGKNETRYTRLCIDYQFQKLGYLTLNRVTK